MGADSPSDATAATPLPFGIEPRHVAPRGAGWRRPLLFLVLLGLPIVAALLGFLGGGPPPLLRAATPQAVLTVETPEILRSGNWFETLVVARPRRDVADLTIVIDQELWRRMSIDTLVPDAEKSEAADGGFAYSFGPVEAGGTFVLKLDGQIQPHGLRQLSGAVALRDGERELARVPLRILVLP